MLSQDVFLEHFSILVLEPGSLWIQGLPARLG